MLNFNYITAQGYNGANASGDWHSSINSVFFWFGFGGRGRCPKDRENLPRYQPKAAIKASHHQNNREAQKNP